MRRAKQTARKKKLKRRKQQVNRTPKRRLIWLVACKLSLFSLWKSNQRRKRLSQRTKRKGISYTLCCMVILLKYSAGAKKAANKKPSSDERLRMDSNKAFCML